MSGSVALTAEMQARYAAEVFGGSVVLPDVKMMEKSIQDDIRNVEKEGLKNNTVSFFF